MLLFTGTSNTIQRRQMTTETPPHSIRKVGERTEEAHLERQAARAKWQKQHAEWERMDEMAKIKSLMDAIDENKTEGTFYGVGPRKLRKCGKWNEATEEEERLKGKKDITVQYVGFCEVTTTKVHAVLQRVPSDLRGGTFRQHPRVLVSTLCVQRNPEKPTSPPCCHVPDPSGVSMLLRVLSTTEDHEARELFVEIQH